MAYAQSLGTIYNYQSNQMKLPHFNISDRTGENGVTILKSIVEKTLNWQFRVNHKEHDFGIDAYIDIINDYNQLTGKTIAIQIKTGKSYFKEKNEHGIIYRDSIEHLNYYLNHDIPVLIILVDDYAEKAYWCICDPIKTVKSGENWKITIPYSQIITEESKTQLLKFISPTIDYASQLEQFWIDNERLRNSDKIAIIIEREQIENKSIEAIVSVIERLHISPELIKSIKEKVDIVIDGYNEDSRELRDIPEIKTWIDLIFPQILGWSYFLSKDENSFFLKIMILCHMEYEEIPGTEFIKDGIVYYSLRVNYLSGLDFLEKIYDNLNAYTEMYSISEEINKEISINLHRMYING